MNTITLHAKVTCGLRGRLQLTRRKVDTLTVVEQTPWFDNIIVDIGLDRLGTIGPIATYCRVGTNGTVPSAGQTALLGYVADTSTIQSNLEVAQATPPYFGRLVRTYRFAAGVAAGTLAEVGIGWGDNNLANTLWCRALILDALGVPTTITVLSDEVLDVTYELRLYPDLDDKVFSAPIGPNTHDCILRACNVTGNDQWANPQLWNFGFTNLQWPRVYNGTLGSITTAPSGTTQNASPTTPVISAYVPGSYERTLTSSWGLNDGNLVGGITAFVSPSTVGEYKMSFSPPIPKTNLTTLNLAMKFIWARYTP